MKILTSPSLFAADLLNIESEGFFWFQTQQTPNLNTENGWAKWPTDLDKMSRPYFPHMMREISADPPMLGKVNIVAGDFMEKDTMNNRQDERESAQAFPCCERCGALSQVGSERYP